MASNERPGGPRTSFAGDFRRFFLRGLSVLVPTLVTIAILVWSYNFIDRTIGRYMTNLMLQIMASGDRKPELVQLDDALTFGEPINEWDAEGRRLTVQYKQLTHPRVSTSAQAQVYWELFFRKYHLNVVGFLLGILFIYFVGYLLASFIGRTTWHVVERSFFRVPFIKAVYPHVKQVTDLLLAEKKMDVSAVVAAEYPRKGIWSLGLVVGHAFEPLRSKFSGDFLTVFIMASPTPFTGYPIWIQRDEVIELPVSLDEAVRYCVSCGVVTPGGNRVLQLRAKSPWQSTDTAAKSGSGD